MRKVITFMVLVLLGVAASATAQLAEEVQGHYNEPLDLMLRMAVVMQSPVVVEIYTPDGIRIDSTFGQVFDVTITPKAGEPEEEGFIIQTPNVIPVSNTLSTQMIIIRPAVNILSFRDVRLEQDYNPSWIFSAKDQGIAYFSEELKTILHFSPRYGHE